MKIGIIGTSRIGATLGRAWASAGHDVMFGVREKPRTDDLPGTIGSVSEAVQHGEAVLFAVPGRALLEAAHGLNLAGKIILDATNGGDTDKPVVQRMADQHPQAFVYKAFNTLGYENFQQPIIAGERADMLFIGHESQQERAAELIQAVGLNPVYVGDLQQTGILDAALALWFGLSRRFGRNLAFKVLHQS